MESNKLRQDNLLLRENYSKAQILGATPVALCQNPSFSRILPLTIFPPHAIFLTVSVC